MIGAVQLVHSKGIDKMKNKEACEDNKDVFPMAYFHRWDKRGQKTEKIFIRLRPEDKKIILSACSAAGLTISDMVMGSAREASDVIIQSYRARVPNDPMVYRPSSPA